MASSWTKHVILRQVTQANQEEMDSLPSYRNLKASQYPFSSVLQMGSDCK